MPGTIFGEGKTDVIYVATDPAGNMAKCTFSVTITVEKCNPYIGTSTVQTLRDQTCPSTNNHLGASCYFTCMEGYATKDGQVQGYFECAKTMSVSTKMAQWRNSIGACELIPTKSPSVITGDTGKQTGDNNSGGSGAASGATPAIVGIVVAALLILIVIGVVAFFLWRRMSRGDLSKPSQFRYVNHSNEISEIPGDPNYATIGRVNQPENDYEGLNTAQANGDGGISNPMYDQMNPPPTKKPGEFDDLSQQAVLKVQSDTTKA
ncbi:uncharacterized protein LOC106170117 [Lingula anatina]|uniref:Uncharacterized protein LOC106170117 n=1 Tax=Lingula anatina TaxID=7574 RepID=A0A2R2MIU6_LINAN|nr:uncharacterized protein LOC106170117 [Lingula anatina]|eukprot:XP_023929972.1 uncharacterized protein LOC106170117 [Lingula anatina]